MHAPLLPQHAHQHSRQRHGTVWAEGARARVGRHERRDGRWIAGRCVPAPAPRAGQRRSHVDQLVSPCLLRRRQRRSLRWCVLLAPLRRSLAVAVAQLWGCRAARQPFACHSCSLALFPRRTLLLQRLPPRHLVGPLGRFPSKDVVAPDFYCLGTCTVNQRSVNRGHRAALCGWAALWVRCSVAGGSVAEGAHHRYT